MEYRLPQERKRSEGRDTPRRFCKTKKEETIKRLIYLSIVMVILLGLLPAAKVAGQTGPIPPSTTPDKVESRIGTLEFTESQAEPGSLSTKSTTTCTSRTLYS